MMDTQRLANIVLSTTTEFRKGPAQTLSEVGKNVRVVEIFAMPHVDDADANLVKVDCHFIVVGVDKQAAEAVRDDLEEVLAEWPDPGRLAGGPSYIETGGVIGSQDIALRMYALGEVLGLWTVITPERFGLEGEQAHELAGRGFVMMTGYSPTKRVEA